MEGDDPVVTAFETWFQDFKSQMGAPFHDSMLKQRFSSAPVRYENPVTDDRWLGFSAGYNLALQDALAALKHQR